MIIGLILVIAIVIGFSMRSHKTDTAPVQTEATQQAPAAESESKPSAQRSPAPARTDDAPSMGAAAKGEIINRVVPDVPHNASSTIHGKVKVAVRATVDTSGNVIDAQFETHGPSAYFARLAMEAAKNSKFKPPMVNGRAVASTWLMHYEFRRDGTDVSPVETKP
jgi:TonB family protein